MTFAPCERVSTETDGTITVSGMFNRLTALGPPGPVWIESSVLAILTGGLGEFDISAQLVSPDGEVLARQTATRGFTARDLLVGTQWRLRARTSPGEHELQLLLDGGSPSVALPFVVVRA